MYFMYLCILCPTKIKLCDVFQRQLRFMIYDKTSLTDQES